MDQPSNIKKIGVHFHFKDCCWLFADRKHTKLRETGFFPPSFFCVIPFLRNLVCFAFSAHIRLSITLDQSHLCYTKSFPMERRAVALRAMIKKHHPKKENLDPRTWMREETLRGFADFIRNKHSDKDTDTSFDTKEMCKYTRTTTPERWKIMNRLWFYRTEKA